MPDRATPRLDCTVKSGISAGDVVNAYVYGDREAQAYIEFWNFLSIESLRALIVGEHDGTGTMQV